jgi:hypothetical protein
MPIFLSELALIAVLSIGTAQGPSNRPADPPATTVRVAAACCGATTIPAPPPQGTNKGLLTEPRLLTSLVDTVVSRTKNEGDVTNGPYLKFGAGVPGAGWIAAGPGYKHLFGERLLFDASGTVSWRQYLNGRARLELRPLASQSLALGAQVLGQDWTQVNYFGLGLQSRQENRSSYRLRASDFSGYVILSPGNVLDLRARVGQLNRPRISEATGWNKSDYPDTLTLFSGLTDAAAPGLAVQPKFWHADVSASLDMLDHPGHPTRGLFLEAAASQFDDRDFDRYSFRRYEGTAIAFVPIVGNRWTLGARAIAIASTTSGTNQVPFYMMPSLGQAVLRGFDTGRFTDRNLVSLNLESRWALFQHLDIAVFGDFGAVAPQFKALDSGDRESSFGVGLRLHTGANTFFRLDAARPKDGSWRMVLKLYESLRSAKDQRWNTVVPVVR